MAIDWKAIAEEELRDYRNLKIAAGNLQAQIAELESELRGIGGGTPRGLPGEISDKETKKDPRMKMPMPHNYTATQPDTRWVSIISHLDKLKENYSRTLAKLDRIESTLKSMSDEHQLILRRLYTDKTVTTAELLAPEIGYSRRQVFYMRDDAISIFAIRMYGSG